MPRARRYRSRRLSPLYLLFVAVLAGCGASSGTNGQLGPSATVVAAPPARLAGSAWERISLPAPRDQMDGFAAAPRDPSTLFACTTSPRPFALWRSTDAGAHWTGFVPLDTRGTDCAVSIAPDDPRRVTLQVSQFAPGEPLCGQDAFSLSTDGGASWRQLPQHALAASAPAASVAAGWCELQVTAHHLFVLSSFVPAPGAAQISLLARSDDDGATWTRADEGVSEVGGNALYSMPQIGPGERLAMAVLQLPATPTPTAPSVAALWTSSDAGRTWTRGATLPAGAGTFLWSAPPQPASTWPNAGHPFYALQQEQIPSDLYREGVLASGDGQGWDALPPLPVPRTDGAHRGILQALAALPDGRLAVWGVDPGAGVPAEGRVVVVRGFWLWLWDPVQTQWQRVAAPLDVTADEGCGLCWQGQAASSADGAQVLYVSDQFDTDIYGMPGAGVWRIRVPP
ncbi:MAG TPA: sialidase family protein, partial [Ktedonobacterales bacterium]|nr:sialidase family protein [Ktedonobacterales bacterium]